MLKTSHNKIIRTMVGICILCTGLYFISGCSEKGEEVTQVESSTEQSEDAANTSIENSANINEENQNEDVVEDSSNENTTEENTTEENTSDSTTSEETDSLGSDTVIDYTQFKGDESVESYFEGDSSAAFSRIDGMLASALRSELELDSSYLGTDATEDIEFQWATVYFYLNTYGDTDGNNLQDENGNLLVDSSVMNTYFTNFFSQYSGTVPEVNTKMGIEYNSNLGGYVIQKSDNSQSTFVLEQVTLSKASSATDPSSSASLTILVQNENGEKVASILVEITKSESSEYGYAIQSVTVE